MRTTMKPEALEAKSGLLLCELERTPDEARSAADLAAFLGFGGQSRENARRSVREVATWARERAGLRICADGEGYWLAQSATEWELYLDARRLKARFGFADAKKIRTAVIDAANRQGRLFETKPAFRG